MVDQALHICYLCYFLFVNVPRVCSLVYQGLLMHEPSPVLIDRINGAAGFGLKAKI